MPLKWPSKDPNEVLDYKHDWSARLGDTDTVESVAAIVEEADEFYPGGVEIDSTNIVGAEQTVWLSGGTLGKVKLTLRIETAQGRTYDEGIVIEIKQR